MVSVNGGASSITGMAQALPRGSECSGDVRRASTLASRALAPRLASSIAQPEDAGLRIGRVVHGVGNRPLHAAMQHGTFDLMAVAQSTSEQLACDSGIGKVASLTQRRREFGDGGDPV